MVWFSNNPFAGCGRESREMTKDDSEDNKASNATCTLHTRWSSFRPYPGTLTPETPGKKPKAENGCLYRMSTMADDRAPGARALTASFLPFFRRWSFFYLLFMVTSTVSFLCSSVRDLFPAASAKRMSSCACPLRSLAHDRGGQQWHSASPLHWWGLTDMPASASYEFSSKPRPVKPRPKFRQDVVGANNNHSNDPFFPVNIHHDPRVARGNTFAGDRSYDVPPGGELIEGIFEKYVRRAQTCVMLKEQQSHS